MQVWWQMLQEEGHALMDGHAGDHMIIVKHEQCLARLFPYCGFAIAEQVDQQRQHALDAGRSQGAQDLQRVLTHSWIQRIQNGEEIRPEARNVTISLVKRKPG